LVFLILKFSVGYKWLYKTINRNSLVCLDPMLGGSQLLNWFSTRFSTTRFPQWEPIDTRKCENPTENRPQVLIWPRTGYENRFKCIHILGNRTGSLIELKSGSQSCVYSFIGSSCSSCPLGLLLFFLLLLLFSHYYCSLFIGTYSSPYLLLLFFPFLLFLWWSHLIIN